jgi:hypothetical protein
MGKIIRKTYPVEFSIGLLLLVFALSFFLSGQIFEIKDRELDGGENTYLGMFLVSCAIVIMLLVLWEEFLFPVRVKPVNDGVVFRNHRNKLKKQVLIYCVIPVIFGFIYVEYEVNLVRFMVWAAVCIIVPVTGKLISGIKNYNDFLSLTNDTIEYKNNEKVGVFKLTDVQHITLIKDERSVLHKIQLLTTDNNQVTIDLDEMELEAFFDSIDKFISVRYKNRLKTASSSAGVI